MSLKLYIPKQRHSELIGKGGATVKQIQQDHGVRIEIPGRDDPSNEVLIFGKEDELKKVHQVINTMLGVTVSTEPLVHMSLNIPSNQHGALIGKGGATLHDLEKKFNVSIKVPRQGDSDPYVGLDGSQKDLKAALEEIEHLLKTKVSVVSPSKAANVAPPKTAPPIVLDNTPLHEAIFFPDKDPQPHNMEKFLAYLNSSTKTLDICVFTITDDHISNVIVNAHKKGVKVRIITDNDTSIALGSDIQRFRDHGIPVKMDVSPYHMHHKFAVIDQKLLINGSFNWTLSASTHNCENVMITNNNEFVSKFQKQFDSMWNDTVNFQ